MLIIASSFPELSFSKLMEIYLEGNMEKAHEETKDWEVFVPLEILRQREATQNIFTIVMSSIAGISLHNG